MARPPSLLDEYLAPKPTPVSRDPLVNDLAERQRRDVGLYLVHDGDPQKAGRANELARQFGVPAETVERNIAQYEAAARQRHAQALLQMYPILGQWLSDPRNVAVARDDVGNLAQIIRTTDDYWLKRQITEQQQSAERARRNGVLRAPSPPAPTLLNFIKGVGSDFVQSFRMMKAGIGIEGADAIGDWAPPSAPGAPRWAPRGPEAELKAYRRAEATMEAHQPQFRSWYMRGLYGGVSSFAQMLPATALSVATANPLPVLGYAGLSTQSQAYGKYRARGATPRMAAAGSAGEGAIEVATEMLPMKFLVAKFGKAGMGEFVAGMLGRELPMEQVATFTQDAIDASIANPDMTVKQFAEQRLGAAGETFVATVAQSLILGGPSHLLNRARQRGNAEIGAQEAEIDAAFLDNLSRQAAESKVRQRDPDAFRRFIEAHSQGSPVENVYIPGEALRELYQSDAAEGPFFADHQTQIEEAIGTGGDVVVPLAEAMTRLAGTPAWEAIKDHVRLSPGGMSAAEARSFEEAKADELKAMSDEMGAEFDAEQEAMEPRRKIAETIRDKLMHAGFRPDVAMQYAELTAARYATRAARLGMELTGEEASGLEIRSGGEPLAGEAFEQMPRPLAMGLAALATITPISHGGQTAAAPIVQESRAGMARWQDRYAIPDWRAKLTKLSPDEERQFVAWAAENHVPLTDDYDMRGFWKAGGATSINRNDGLPHYPDRFKTPLHQSFSGESIYANPKSGPPKWNDRDQLVLPDGTVLFDEREEAGRALYQSFNEGPRGKITFAADGKSIIDLFEARDLSTFIHESGHLFLEELKADAESMASPEVFADYEAVKAWFRREGFAVGEDGSIPTEAHELWARGFERFAMEGKAPTSALRRAFEAFRSWLLTIYKVVDNLRSPITDDIRAVMERLIATDEEIAAAKEEQNIKALFSTAGEAGMTEAQFADYQRATVEARNEAYDALLYRAMSAIRRQKTQAWKDEEIGVRAEIIQKTDAQPVFKALRLLTGAEGGGKLDRGWLIETYGAEAPDLLPKRVPPIHAAKGVNADDLAEMAGFESGDEMVRMLMGLEARTRELRANGDKRSVRQVQIDEATAETMLDRHGDILNDGSIEDEARALIHNDRQGEVIASEIRALARRANKRPTPYALAREWAANKIAIGKVAESTSGSALQRYERSARNAAKAAEKAMLAGDVDETYRQKQVQMLNNALIVEAKKAKDAIDSAVARLGKLAKRATSKTIAQDHLDQVHVLLEQVEFRARSQVSLDKQESFEAWANAQEAQGHDIVVPPSFAASLGSTHWTRLTVEQLLGLDDTVKQIVHLGRLKQKLIDNKEERDFNEIVGEAIAGVSQLPPRPPSDMMEPNFGDRLKSKAANFDAALLKMETIVDWLDGANPEGVFNRIVFKPIAEAQATAADMFGGAMASLAEALAKIPKETLRRWSDKVSAPELLNVETGNPFILSRQQLISMALNMGNEGNAQRLADGYRWNQVAIMEVLNRELTPAEWAYVQEVWDIIDGFWPQIEAMEKRVNGVAPGKIEARTLETSAGTLRGGYFPAVYDSARDYAAERNAGKESDLFETKYTRATTRSSATKERAERVKRPILLNLGVITRHLGEVIHDITHREAVMNADKFLSDERIMRAVDETLGPAIRKQFRPWLKFVANQWAAERAGNEGVGAFLNKLRSNATVVGMGFRASTMMMQIVGYSNSFEAVGARWVTPAIAQTSANPIETFNFVMERSGEVRHRMDTLDRDIDAGIRRLAGKNNPLTQAKRFAFHGIGYMDRVVVIPTWMGAYNKALSQGLEEDAAIYAADKAVRQSQGAGAAKDLAAVARGTGQWGQAFKLLTMFYSYLSAVYQRQRTLGRDTASAFRQQRYQDLPGLMARAWWLVVVPPLLSELVAGRGPDDDEDWGWWSFRQMMMQGLGAIPVARDLVKPMWDALSGGRPFDYQLSPLQRAGQVLIDAGKDANRLWEGEDTKHATKDTLEAAGYWTGLVPGQVATATQFLVNVGYGEQEPDSVGDWWSGLTTGKIPEE